MAITVQTPAFPGFAQIFPAGNPIIYYFKSDNVGRNTYKLIEVQVPVANLNNGLWLKILGNQYEYVGLYDPLLPYAVDLSSPYLNMDAYVSAVINRINNNPNTKNIIRAIPFGQSVLAGGTVYTSSSVGDPAIFYIASLVEDLDFGVLGLTDTSNVPIGSITEIEGDDLSADENYKMFLELYVEGGKNGAGEFMQEPTLYALPQKPSDFDYLDPTPEYDFIFDISNIPQARFGEDLPKLKQSNQYIFNAIKYVVARYGQFINGSLSGVIQMTVARVLNASFKNYLNSSAYTKECPQELTEQLVLAPYYILVDEPLKFLTDNKDRIICPGAFDYIGLIVDGFGPNAFEYLRYNITVYYKDGTSANYSLPIVGFTDCNEFQSANTDFGGIVVPTESDVRYLAIHNVLNSVDIVNATNFELFIELLSEPNITITETINYRVFDCCDFAGQIVFQNRFGIMEFIPYKRIQQEVISLDRKTFEKQINAGLPDERNRRIDTTIKNLANEIIDILLLFRGLYKNDEWVKQFIESNSVYLIDETGETIQGDNIFIWGDNGTFESTEFPSEGINYSPNLVSQGYGFGHPPSSTATRCVQGATPLDAGIYPVADNYFFYSNDVTLKPNTKYILECWGLVEEAWGTLNGQTTQIYVDGLSGASTTLYTETITTPTIGVWQRMRTEVTTGANFETIKLIVAEVDVNQYTEPSVMRFDDISIYEETTEELTLVPVQILDTDAVVNEFAKPYNKEIGLRLKKDYRNTTWGTSNY